MKMNKLINLTHYAKVLNIDENALSVVGEGANGIVLTDGHDTAYKFPKHEQSLMALKNEIEIMNNISGSLSFQVPKFTTICLDYPIGSAYCAYPLIDGVPLTTEIYLSKRQLMSKQLLLMIDEIHQIKPISAMKTDKLDFEIMFNDIKKLLFPLITQEGLKQEITLKFEAHLKTEQTFEQTECVIHGDLGSVNILCNPIIGTITGIIDWAGISIGNPVIDYSSLTCAKGIPPLKEDLLKLRPSLSTVFEFSEFIQYTFPIQEALFGVITSDEQSLNDGLTVMISNFNKATEGLD